ncbi:hypothetical protein SAMN05880590_101143 [Rhizobium sp. RU35A]|uniref:AbrB family transcriptional regulator n=1 Tax=Rhizobium sp. RU35A TaxID=1907414 RepID=UPI000957220E|nr:AbrB family transcriptional regulator [Rhizobium sp. RU35A]SIP90864.1 hypothetical protein SAMN05880590_101143 [Rhizobium sp. RU35A]
MAYKVTIGKSGETFVLPLPQEAVGRLGLSEGQSADLHLDQTGLYLSVAEVPAEDAFDQQLEAARWIMRKYNVAREKLARE